jgi:hypothetical protein
MHNLMSQTHTLAGGKHDGAEEQPATQGARKSAEF